jgi:hypothetical protein
LWALTRLAEHWEKPVAALKLRTIAIAKFFINPPRG